MSGLTARPTLTASDANAVELRASPTQVKFAVPRVPHHREMVPISNLAFGIVGTLAVVGIVAWLTFLWQAARWVWGWVFS